MQKQKFDVDKLKQEKEAEISNLVTQLDSVKSEADQMRLILEKYTARKEEAAEEKKELTEQLKRVQKAAKKKKEVLQEIDKLGGQDLRVL